MDSYGLILFSAKKLKSLREEQTPCHSLFSHGLPTHAWPKKKLSPRIPMLLCAFAFAAYKSASRHVSKVGGFVFLISTAVNTSIR